MYKFTSIRGGAGGAYFPPDTSTGLSWSQRPPVLPRFTCGLTPQALVKFFSALDIVKNAVGVFVFIYFYIKLRNADKEYLIQYYDKNSDMKDFLRLGDWEQRGILLGVIILFVIAFIMSIVCYCGARQANYSKLRAWFLYQLIALIGFSALHIWTFFHGWLLPDRPKKVTGSCFLIFFLNYLWAGYSMYVTYLLMKDISFYIALSNRVNGPLRLYQQQQEFR